MKNFQFMIIAILLSITACNQKIQPQLSDDQPLAIEQWRLERKKAIIGANGWMSLAGLYWLKEGENTFGSNERHALVFPKNAPENIGVFELDNGKVTMRIEENIPVKHVTTMPKNIDLISDKLGDPTTLQLDNLSWYLVQRENRFGIRLKDSQHPKIATFKGIERFPYTDEWKIPARLEPALTTTTITLRNVIDMDVTMKLEGYLAFKINGVSYQLEALDGGPDTYFVIFADETTGIKTYGGGRYLYVPRVDENKHTIIDFNKAHNPPCAFTDYATCPLPSATNHLEVPILAGEKDYH